MKHTDYDSKAQNLIHSLLKELDKSQAIIPTKIGTQNQELQTTENKVTGKRGKYVRKNKTNKESRQEKDGEKQNSNTNKNEKEEVTSDSLPSSPIDASTLDLVEELKKRNTLQKEYRKAVEKEVKQTILFQPHPGPQTDFLASTEYEVGFFGGRSPLAYGEKVITPTGAVPVEKIKIGDVVCTPDGGTATVVNIPYDGVAPCATITFSDGRTVTSTIDHTWTGRTRKGKTGYQRRNRVVKTEEFKNGGQVPLATPVYHKPQNVLLDPYFMGIMLGDGCVSNAITLTSWDEDIINYAVNLYPNYNFIGKEYKEIRFTYASRKELKTIFTHYNLYGCVSNSKHIPKEYLYNSVEVRLALLQGLMDTDGYADGSKACKAEYTTVSKALAKDVQQLVWSLGGRATLSTKVGSYTKNNQKVMCQKVYRLYITLQSIVPFRLPRKADRYTKVQAHLRKNYLTVTGYKEVGELQARCITIDNPKHEILTTNYVVTKNSGKSICLLVDPLRFVDNPTFKGLLLRKTMPALREIISRAKQLYPKVKPGTKWKEAEKIFEFPSGATIEFGYYDHIDDYDRYHGREFAWLGIDEITQWATQEYYDRIKSVVRSTDPLLDPRIRATCNPSGPGRGWVKEYFGIEPNIKTKSIRTEYEVLGQIHSISRKYIISTVFDNPSTVENDPQYIAFLQSLPPSQRKQWLDGDFEAVDGLAFEEFTIQTHVIDPFPVPSGWLKVRAIDWGFRGKAVCLWAAFNKEGQAFLYRELVTSKVHSDTFAKMVLELEEGEYVSYGVIDGQAGVQSGINGPTVEEDFIKNGLVNQHADKKAGSRMHSKQLLHKYLRLDPETGEPMLKIFSTCRQIIKELGSLMVDPHNSEDIDQRQDDDAYDTLRYLLSSRPDPEYTGDIFTDSNRYKQSMPIIVNTKYGY